MLSYERYKRDLRPWGGPKDARIVDNIVQEIDLKTGAVLFEWHTFGNVVAERVQHPAARPRPASSGSTSTSTRPRSLPDGNFLISARNTSTIYKINRATGKIMWRLGGKKSDFKLGAGRALRLAAQRPLAARRHDARSTTTRPRRRCARTRACSRSRSTSRPRRPRSCSAFKHPLGLLSSSQGNVETLPNGNLFVGWGSQRYFTEFDAQGKVVFDGHLARGNDNYRAFRFPWVGTPSTPPKVVASPAAATTTARVCWNGATEVARWQLLGGAARDGARAGRPAQPTAGFETALTADRRPPFVAAARLDAAGNVLVTTAAVKPGATK